MSPRTQALLRAADARQNARARVFLKLSDISSRVTARDFAVALHDLATLNARWGTERGFTRDEREEWARLAELLERFAPPAAVTRK